MTVALGARRETGYVAFGELSAGATGGGDQRKNQGFCRRCGGRGDADRDPLRRRQDGLACLGRRPAAGAAAWRLWLVDALGSQRAAAGARIHRDRPRFARARRVGDPSRAAHRREAGADHRRWPRHRAAARRAAAPRRVLVRRRPGRACRGRARRPCARLYDRRLERARPAAPADRAGAPEGGRDRRRAARRSRGTISAC